MTEQAETKKRARRNGTIIGAAIDKLNELNEQERLELLQSPADIRARFDKRRNNLLSTLDAAQRKSVEAAVAASVPEEPEEEVTEA